MGPFAFCCYSVFKDRAQALLTTKAPRYECRDELAKLTQLKCSVNVFIYSFLFLMQPETGRSEERRVGEGGRCPWVPA